MPDEHFTELISDRIMLRRFALADLTTFVAYRSNPEVARYQSWEAPYPLADGKRMISKMLGEHPDTARPVVPVRHGPAFDQRAHRRLRGRDRRRRRAPGRDRFHGQAGVPGPRLRDRGGAHAARLPVRGARQAPRDGPLRRAEHRIRRACSSGSACAARATCAKAPGRRASGPTSFSVRHARPRVGQASRKRQTASGRERG